MREAAPHTRAPRKHTTLAANKHPHGHTHPHPHTHARAQETARLAKMAGDKGVAAAKKETFAWRLNVLRSFTASGDGGEGAADGGGSDGEL